jgi:hypothetical protein
MRCLISVIGLLLLALPVVTTAQVQQRPPPQQQQQPQPEDTIPVPPFRFEPPVSPMGAMLRSMVLPGWGQAVLRRRGAGAVFVFFEGLTLAMWVKSLHQDSYLKSTDADAETLESKGAEIEDWLVLLVFNHLLAGTEAYVSANLWDFPAELEARALPAGSVGLGATVYLPPIPF